MKSVLPLIISGKDLVCYLLVVVVNSGSVVPEFAFLQHRSCLLNREDLVECCLHMSVIKTARLFMSYKLCPGCTCHETTSCVFKLYDDEFYLMRWFYNWVSQYCV